MCPSIGGRRFAVAGRLQPRPRTRGAFTLIELLVVIGIIGILAALLLPCLTAAKQRALRARCLANVKQYSLAFISYAIDNNDKLPVVRMSTDDPNPVKMDPPVIDMMIHQYGLTQDVLYCPAYPDFNNVFNTNLPFGGYTGVLGYCTSAPGNAPVFEPNSTIAPVLIFDNISALNVMTQPSKRTLVADMVPSNRKPWADTNSTAMSDYTFIDVQGDLTGYSWTILRASHINYKRQPAGGNEGMLDGHATWVKFTDMVLRTGDDYHDTDHDSPYYWW